MRSMASPVDAAAAQLRATASPLPPPLHVADVDEEDENVKQLKECAALYLSLQDCLVETNRDWRSCQKRDSCLATFRVQLLPSRSDRRSLNPDFSLVESFRTPSLFNMEAPPSPHAESISRIKGKKPMDDKLTLRLVELEREELHTESSHCIVGKLWTDKPQSLHTMHTVLSSIWNKPAGFRCEEDDHQAIVDNTPTNDISLTKTPRNAAPQPQQSESNKIVSMPSTEDTNLNQTEVLKHTPIAMINPSSISKPIQKETSTIANSNAPRKRPSDGVFDHVSKKAKNVKQNGKKFQHLLQKCGFDCSYVVSSIGNAGGLILAWRSQFNVQVLYADTFFIQASCVSSDASQSWQFIGLHLHFDKQIRKHQIEALLQLINTRTSPILLGGDFNTILRSSEKNGGKEFHTSMTEDLSMLLNEEAWKIEVTGSPQYRVHMKLNNVRNNILAWLKNNKRNSASKVEALQQRLLSLSRKHDVSSVETRKIIETELQQAIQEEETYWRQKSRIKWMKEGHFFKHFWPLIEEDITAAATSFIRSRRLLKALNRTSIALIPKTKIPENMSQIRPISLSNFIYKYFSKILVHRIQPLMNKIISTNQCAFIKGRLISDNILLAHQMMHHLKTK
ncbi:hypothetical protein Cni_G21171 [Canna indica]|uniref:Reverse transcriptase domain-containing protein n=1 Tax=Canna indica TaxID=4628 RepID=A0AAQ3QIF1_9LILI|nr:hypothetical protein Cni_G21171 [Canna indica]